MQLPDFWFAYGLQFPTAGNFTNAGTSVGRDSRSTRSRYSCTSRAGLGVLCALVLTVEAPAAVGVRERSKDVSDHARSV